MLLVVLLAQSFGLLIGAAFMDPKTAQTVTTIVMLTFLLVGGFYVRDVPTWMAWIRYISFVYWGYNLLLKIQFGGGGDGALQYYDCSTAGGGGGCTPVTDLGTALRMPVDPNQSPWLEVVVLIGMMLLLRALTYWVLKRKTATRLLVKACEEQTAADPLSSPRPSPSQKHQHQQKQ